MTLKNNIRESLLYFPTIYDNALDVLHHMYCVIGNRYEWVNGICIRAKIIYVHTL